ncbi:MAG TPA: LysR family transcriptional regulator [Burkholderiaceae bacterium]|nr:LysR family transcriptional regulator [Burkholderiaceae bacterium]
MDTRDLDTLMLVIRHGSFAAAARQLNVDPSSVSRVVAGLETELGMRLFNRNTRQLVLTEAGSAFAEHLGLALDEFAHARSAAVDAVGEVRGRLRMTMSNAVALHCVSPLLPAFCAANPALELDMQLSELPVDLFAERMDVAIRLSNLRDSSLVAVPLFQIKYRVVASPAWVRANGAQLHHPLDLKNVACLCFARVGHRDCWQFTPTGGGDMVEFLVRPRLIATNALMLREGALSGLGPALLADWMSDDDVAAGTLVDLFPQHTVSTANAPSTGWALYPSRSYVPAKVRVFIDYLQASKKQAKAKRARTPA